MTDPTSVAAADGARPGGVPRWLAGALTVLRGAANVMAAGHCDGDCYCRGAGE